MLILSNLGLDDKDVSFDQFKVNESLFGIKSTYVQEYEETYTTILDANDPLLKSKLDRAAKLAKEIETVYNN